MAESTAQLPAEKLVGSIERERSRVKVIRILHVDDEPDLSKVVKQCLELQGPFHVDTADSVEEAFNKLKEKEYDAVVSDYQMPGKDGLQFLKELREKGNSIPFVVLTGKSREEIAVKALNLDADGYINKQGSPETVYCELAHSLKSVVATRKAEEALRSSEEKHRAYVENSPVAFFVTNSEGKYEQVNDAACKLLGYTKEELLEMTTADVAFERDTPQALKHASELKETGKSRVEFKLKRKDGEPVHVILNAAKLPNGNRIGFCEDITERKKMEEEKSRLLNDLRDRVKELSCFFGMSRLYEKSDISLDDALQRTADLLPPAMQYPGITCARIISENREFFTKNFKETRWKLQADIKVQGEKAGFVEVCYLEERPTIAEDPFLKEERLLIDAVAERLGRITERMKIERASKESEARIRSIVESSSDQIFMLDRDYRFLSINKTGANLFRMRPEEIIGRPISKVFPETTAAQFSKNIKNVFDSGKSMRIDEKMVVEGREWYSSSSLNPVGDDSGRVIAVTGIVRDITESKRTEAELRRLATIVTDSNDAVTVVDKDGRITAWNKGAEHIYGYGKDEALGMDVLKIVPEDKKQETLDFIGKIKMNETVESFETKRLTRDGRVLDVWLTITKLVDDGGNAIALATTERDITERKRLEERLRFSEKFTVLGQLASSVAHEIRNPLGVIKNSIYFLNDVLKEYADEKVVKHLRIMERNVNSADRIISDLLDVGRNKVGVLEPVDLNVILERALANTSVPKNIKVITRLDKIPKMLLDSEHIHRVFVNIIQNAIAAMPEGGKLIVEVSRSGDSVEISFKDSGVGIPEENMQKLFTPLFTTKANGLGLGLTICKQIVESHKGEIEVKSKAGEGTLFIIRLPILSEAGLVNIGLTRVADVLIGGMSE